MTPAIRASMAVDTLTRARRRLAQAEQWAADGSTHPGLPAYIAACRDNVTRLDPDAQAVLIEARAVVTAAVGADWLEGTA